MSLEEYFVKVAHYWVLGKHRSQKMKPQLHFSVTDVQNWAVNDPTNDKEI